MVETDQLQPGPELDAAIAKLLGWKKIVENHDSKLSLIGYWRIRGGSSLHLLSRWSTDDVEAFELLQQLCRPKEDGGRGWIYVIHSPDDTRDKHFIAIGYEERRGNCDCSRACVGYGISFARAASVAIHAALEAENVV